MVSVKGEVPDVERHIAMLLGGLMDEIRNAFAAEDWGGLRQSHFRVIAHVPEGGISVTELAERVRMTKQGCGQFVTQLVVSGHLETAPSPVDARVRLVRRTPEGRGNVVDVTARMAEIERAWAESVGERRYAAFRRVAEDIAGMSLP